MYVFLENILANAFLREKVIIFGAYQIFSKSQQVTEFGSRCEFEFGGPLFSFQAGGCP